MSDDWIQTYSGERVKPLTPKPENIKIIDIAHALSQICRFTGHTKFFLSVAQHSVLVSKVVPPGDALWGLMHDASEAYLADLASPIKRQPQMDIYKEAESRLMGVICHRFGLPAEMPESVNEADTRMLVTEMRDAFDDSIAYPMFIDRGLLDYPDLRITSWPPDLAKSLFLERFLELTS